MLRYAAFAVITAASLAVVQAQTPSLIPFDVCQGPVGVARAADIAMASGLVTIRSVACDDGAWEVEGRDQQGRRMQVEIDPRDGRVLKTERDS